MVNDYIFNVINSVANCVTVTLLGLISCILLQMAKEQKLRGDKAAYKAEEVKETLEKSSELLAKESTLQELKDKT